MNSKEVQVGDVIRITINGQDYYAKVRAVAPPYCKLELPRYVPVDGKRVKVYVARLSDIK